MEKTKSRKLNGYWTKERCQEESLKYETKKEFHKNSSSAYTKSFKNHWLNEICSHMKAMIKPKFYWTKEKCIEEALKYSNKKEFQKNCNSAYLTSNRNRWMDEISSHMKELIKPDGYWTKEKCQEESLKYRTKTEYSKNSSYQQAWSNDWIDEICSHMEILGNKYRRCIYVYEFEDDSAYIGLTFNAEIRHSNHISNESSQVYKKIKENIPYKHKILTEYINVEESKFLEKYYIDEYKKNKWNILNVAKSGGVGGNFSKWTKEKCLEESLKYKTRVEFKKINCSAYNVVMKNKWDVEMFDHMIRLQKPNGYWTKERCLEEALKYDNRREFKKNSIGYPVSSQKGWLNEICSHMNKKKELYNE